MVFNSKTNDISYSIHVTVLLVDLSCSTVSTVSGPGSLAVFRLVDERNWAPAAHDLKI